MYLFRCLNIGVPPSKAKYKMCVIVYEYREGKVKKIPGSE